MDEQKRFNFTKQQKRFNFTEEQKRFNFTEDQKRFNFTEEQKRFNFTSSKNASISQRSKQLKFHRGAKRFNFTQEQKDSISQRSKNASISQRSKNNFAQKFCSDILKFTSCIYDSYKRQTAPHLKTAATLQQEHECHPTDAIFIAQRFYRIIQNISPLILRDLYRRSFVLRILPTELTLPCRDINLYSTH